MSRSPLLACQAVSKAYGTRSLFDELSFGLFEGDRAGLVGPNGAGKSTLLKILAGLETPDRGSRSVRGGVRVGYVPQDPILPSGGTVEGVVAAALAGVDEGDRPGRIALALGRAGFADERADVDTLSGGWKKRSCRGASPGRIPIACATPRIAVPRFRMWASGTCPPPPPRPLAGAGPLGGGFHQKILGFESRFVRVAAT